MQKKMPTSLKNLQSGFSKPVGMNRLSSANPIIRIILIRIANRSSNFPKVHQIVANTGTERYTNHEDVIFTVLDITVQSLCGLSKKDAWFCLYHNNTKLRNFKTTTH